MDGLVAEGAAEGAAGRSASGAAAGPAGAPRLRRPDRLQVVLEPVCLEERLAADHPARAVWAVVQRLDLAKFQAGIAARGERPGRPTTDPALLIALWLFATIQNEGSARRLAALCESHDAYRWLCGGVSLNHHTLSDFRSEHAAALDDLFTQVIAALVHKEVVKIDRISQDSLRTRASAGSSSFRRAETLRRLLEEARAHVEAVKQQADEAPADAARRTAARQRAAAERVERIDAALALLPELQRAKQVSQSGKPSKQRPVRVSTTDVEARRMRLGGGAIAPGYNVQFGVDTASRAIVGVDVVNDGNDQQQSEPMRRQVERRSGRKVKEHLFDAGFVKKELIDQAEQNGTAIYAPLPSGKDGQPCTHCDDDDPGVAAWRARMTTPEAQKLYHLRAATAETVNAETKTYRGLSRFLVRGLAKVRCIALWSALAYNVVHFAKELLATEGFAKELIT